MKKQLVLLGLLMAVSGVYGLDRWGNNELQYYQEENVSVGNGVMTITAKRENVGGSQYTSGRIRTTEKGNWTRDCIPTA